MSRKKEPFKTINPWKVYHTRAEMGYSVVIVYDRQDGTEVRRLDLSPVADLSYAGAMTVRDFFEKFFAAEPGIMVGMGSMLRRELKEHKSSLVGYERKVNETRKRIDWIEGELLGRQKKQRKKAGA